MRSNLNLAGLAACLVASPAFAGAATTADSTATVVSEATIEKLTDLNLGSFAGGSGSGLVELNVVDGNRYCANTAVCASSAFSFAQFRIIGGVPVRVTYPSRIYFTGSAGPDMYFDVKGRELSGGAMVVPGGHISTVPGGTTLRLGGWLHMNPSQPNGAYSSSITVTVDYF